MMILNAWLAIPLPLRLGILALMGVAIGPFINLGVYSLVFRPRPISPWSAGPPTRYWYDRLPIVGWLFWRRERHTFGRYFWIRPLLIEVSCGAGLAALYWWETVEQGLLPFPANVPAKLFTLILHAQFAAHALLFLLLLVATFTDFDDRTIPDLVTVPGTIAGMLLLSLVPSAVLLTLNWIPPRVLVPLYALPVPNWSTAGAGLLTALAIIAGWCFALLNKVCTLRRGWKKAIQYFFVSIPRYNNWLLHVVIFLVLGIYTALVWRWGGAQWHGLFTSLMGLAVGGITVWSVRIAGRLALGVEAMGFGDVILLAMIGAFLGWQAALITFFLAPLTGVLVGAARWVLTGDNRMPFGPYLSFAAMLLVVGWHFLWTMRLAPLFEDPRLVALVLLASLPLLGGLMWLVRRLLDALRGMLG